MRKMFSVEAVCAHLRCVYIVSGQNVNEGYAEVACLTCVI